MGIRMRLNVGWGLDLTDRDTTKLRYAHLEDEKLFKSFKTDVLNYANLHDDILEKFSWAPQKGVPTDFAPLVVYDDEFGLKDKALFIPAGQRESWTRYGDLLDAFIFEAQQKDREFHMDPEWLPHPGCLYPYINLMKANPEKPLGIETYWVPCYRNRPKHKDAIPFAPLHFWFLIKHLGLEKPGETTTEAFLTLRPTVYRYWS